MVTQRKFDLCSPNLPIDAKTSCYYRIQPPAVSESLAPSSLHVSTPKDTVNLTSYFPPANFIQFQIPISTEVYREAEPSHWHVPSPFQYGPDFNSQAEDDNISSLTNNPCHSCGRYGPTSPVILSSSSTGSLSMEDGGEPFQQLLDPYTTQYFTIPQPILPYVSNVASSTFKSLGNSHNIYTEIVGSPHLTMTPAIDETAIPQAFPDYDANSSHNYYM